MLKLLEWLHGKYKTISDKPANYRIIIMAFDILDRI